MHQRDLLMIIAVLLAAGAREASAQATPGGTSQGTQGWRQALQQAWLDRGYVNLNVGFETTSGTLNDSTTFGLYDESGTKTVEQNVDSGSVFDFSAGSRVWENVAVGLGYHRGGNSSEASATASVPHPVFFNANRAVAAAASDLDRTERAFHIQIGYMIPLDENLSVHVMAGPSFFRLKQEVLSDLSFTEESFPFTRVNAEPIVTERSDSVVGVNLGVDVTYQLYETADYRVGGGLFLRYSGASARIAVIENEVDSDVGGLQLGFGARVRF